MLLFVQQQMVYQDFHRVIRSPKAMPGYARHVLVIEDEAETADQLVDCLKSSGYEVDLAVDGEDGLRRARAVDYVVMTVDRMLPQIDGIEIVRRLREEGIVTPALIL